VVLKCGEGTDTSSFTCDRAALPRLGSRVQSRASVLAWTDPARHPIIERHWWRDAMYLYLIC
jgi:hypothetical protein